MVGGVVGGVEDTAGGRLMMSGWWSVVVGGVEWSGEWLEWS